MDEDLDLQPASPPAADAVRLLSVHGCKGLEFPVVALAGLATRFNERDLNEPVLLSEQYGLCSRITPPDTEQSYPGLPHWLARRSERRERRGEELRLLYVALTRARDTLLLVGTVNRTAAEARWETEETGAISTAEVTGARSQLDWLLAWLPRATTRQDWRDERAGGNHLLSWQLHDGNDAVFADHDGPAPDAAATAAAQPDAAESIEKVKAMLAWRYPFVTTTAEPAKASVSGLRRRLRDETEDEAAPLFRINTSQRRARRAGGLSAAQIGSAHHLFLQLAALDKLGNAADLKAEADRLRDAGWLTAGEAAALDLDALAAFWQSEIGKEILARRQYVHREIPFTARFSPANLAECGLSVKVAPDEFVVVQGVADLAVILPGEIWLVDFKTDDVKGGEPVDETYELQVKLYALALGRIYHRPVTKACLHFLSSRTTVPVRR